MWSRSETEERQKQKILANSTGKQVNGRRTGYENTTTQARPENINQKTMKPKKYEIIQNTNDARRSERLRWRKAYVLKEGQIAPARTKQHEGEEATGIRTRSTKYTTYSE